MRRLRTLLIPVIAAILAPLCAYGGDTVIIPLADGFVLPVGLSGTKKYFKARGYRPNGHLGEDWNGEGGGDTDLGDPVYAIGHGVVVYSDNFKLGWGNVIIVRHAYYEGGKALVCDSLYGHVDERFVAVGQHVRKGQKIGTIGNNFGMYDAHLHFEIRKNIYVGMFRSYWPRDFTVYFDPTDFITGRPKMPSGRTVRVPIDTFRPGPEGTVPAPQATPPSPLRPRTTTVYPPQSSSSVPTSNRFYNSTTNTPGDPNARRLWDEDSYDRSRSMQSR